MIYLFRQRADPDPYEDALNNAGFASQSVNALETVHVNGEKLGAVVEKGHSQYSGLVMTSARAAECWRDLLQQRPNTRWDSVPLFVVGKGTLRPLAGIAPSHVFGDSSGSGHDLAQIINAHAPGPQPLLHLTGDKTLDVLENECNTPIERLAVYETRVSPHLGPDIRALCDQKTPGVLVFFAPSSADAVLAELEPEFVAASRVVAIGPTTARHLHSRDISVAAQAAEPSPRGVLNAVLGIIE